MKITSAFLTSLAVFATSVVAEGRCGQDTSYCGRGLMESHGWTKSELQEIVRALGLATSEAYDNPADAIFYCADMNWHLVFSNYCVNQCVYAGANQLSDYCLVGGYQSEL